MKALLDAPIRFFKWFAIYFLVVVLPSSVLAQSVTNDEDKAIAEMAKALRNDSAEWNIPVNPHYDAAKQQAAELLNDLKSNPQHQMVEASKKKLAGRTIIFTSMSLGPETMEEIFRTSSVGDGVVVAFRGVTDEAHFAQSILSIQELAAKQSPIAKVVVDPTLFRDYGITSVPTIVYLAEDKETEVARVSGLSSPDWMYAKVKVGKTGDFGVRGPVEDIQERDLIEVLKEKVAGINWADKKEEAIKRYWSKQQFIELPKAIKPRRREIDPSIMISSNITDVDGKVLVPQGTIINPLALRPFHQALIIFDPLDSNEIELVDQRLEQLKNDYSRITLIVTRFDRETGWDSYKSITDHFDAPVFNLTPDIHSRFEIERTPSIVTAEQRFFIVEELALNKESEK